MRFVYKVTIDKRQVTCYNVQNDLRKGLLKVTTAMTVGVLETTAAVVNSAPFNATTLADWIAFCDVKPATQATYNKAVENLFAYLKSNGVMNPAREDIVGYRKWLIGEGGYKVSSARLYMTICKKFFRWLASEGLYLNVADGVKLPETPDTDEHAHDSLTVEEAQATLSSFEGTSEKTLRDKCIMSLMIGAGLRSIEIVRLDIGDWEKRRNQWFLKLQGKGKSGKTQRIAISADLKKAIDDYLAVRPSGKKGSALFISTAARNKGERLQTQSVSRLAKRVFISVGIVSDRITCHSCRATFATLALAAGVPIRKVMKAMRHRSADTTEIYASDINRFNNESVQVVSNLIFSKE